MASFLNKNARHRRDETAANVLVNLAKDLESPNDLNFDLLTLLQKWKKPWKWLMPCCLFACEIFLFFNETKPQLQIASSRWMGGSENAMRQFLEF